MVGLSRRLVVQAWWILLGILILAELFVFPKVPAALLRGSVALNPLGWFGYGELAAVRVDRGTYPVAYWLIVLTLTAFAMFLAAFIYAVVFRAAS
jgi:hypothetical protein